MKVRAFLPAIILALFSIFAAPFLGQIRNALSDAFGELFVKGLAALLALILLVALGIAVAGVQNRRSWRYAGLIVVVALVAIQTFLLGRDIDDPALALQVNVVEKVHLVQYGLLALLLYLPLCHGPARPKLGSRYTEVDSPPSLLTPVTAGLVLLGVALVGIIEEWVQWFVPLRVGEVADVGLNVYAGLLGLLFGVALRPPDQFAWRASRRQVAHLLNLFALVIFVFGGFFHCAHLGYWVEDPEIGSFRAWFPREELLLLREERAQRWAGAAPELNALGREDHYLSAAGWHVNHRNHSFHLGHVFVAWQENRILETYYTPFLDLPQRSGEGTYRLPESQLEQLRQQFQEIADRQPHRVGRYVSPVLEQRIVTDMNAQKWWMGICTLALMLLKAARHLSRVNLDRSAGRY